MTVAFGVHPLLRSGTAIASSLATIIGRVRPADLDWPPRDLRDYGADGLIGPLG